MQRSKKKKDMKTKQETIGRIYYINGIEEGKVLVANKKQYTFKCVAISSINYQDEYYFIVLDSKGNLQVLERNTLVTIL